MSAPSVTLIGNAKSGSCVRLRLTRRGRIVFGAVAMIAAAAFLAGLASFASAQAQATNSAASGQQFHYVVVQAGSSLWSVAAELDPSGDPRDLITEIVSLNQLEGSEVQAGQVLAVPLRFAQTSEHSTVYSESRS